MDKKAIAEEIENEINASYRSKNFQVNFISNFRLSA